MPRTALGPPTALRPARAAVVAALMLVFGALTACEDQPRDVNYGSDAGSDFDVAPVPTTDVATDTKVSDATAEQIQGDTGTDAGVLPETAIEAPADMETTDMADAATDE
jgi:hypothetical protein